MPFVLVALVAGALSILAPCVVGLLPVLIGRSVSPGARAHSAALVIAGLSVSIFVFSALLKGTTWLIDVPQYVWQWIAGGILIAFGVVSLVPSLWDAVSSRLRLATLGGSGVRTGMERQSRFGDVLLGASLGPVFSACSPTYGVIAAVILPASPAEGFVYLGAYVAGLAIMMGVVVFGGRSAVSSLGWGIDPRGWFRRTLGVLFILLGIAIGTGLDKDVLSYVVQAGWFDWQVGFEDAITPSE